MSHDGASIATHAAGRPTAPRACAEQFAEAQDAGGVATRVDLVRGTFWSLSPNAMLSNTLMRG